MTVAVRPGRTRRALGWLVVVVLLVGAGLAAAALSNLGQWSPRGDLDPESAGPDGTRALARTLAGHGVAVRVARSIADADASSGTLAVGDTSVLSDDQVARLAESGRDVVFLAPTARDIRVVFSGTSAGYGSGTPRQPDCGLPAAERAGAVAVGGLFTAGDATWSCYPEGAGFGLLAVAHDGGAVVAVDATALFTNERITRDGNAALALGLLGGTGHVTWYVPSAADADGTPATIGTLTPRWVTPAILLLIAAAAVAAVWRGRRFGPLVAERLPVTVRGGETTRGRARLYATSRDAAHAGSLLRDGARHRLSGALGLPADAAPEAVADAVADRLRASPPGTAPDPRLTLAGPLPRTDADLVRLADALVRLEAATIPDTTRKRTR
ncbi:DUF4350 domain-containing protein [Microbacterium sp. SORGH_AS_0888]|uniref:DUF4350 domain-containing protein n=1 Tax=Microbacterium sp. SORGH_AS_0888 TaxID=3041791 RepID=UPI002784942E|nr:DUF4350 domain-containing protein [Microbacterium sp. SORGH_AS_0888]MDQ1127917.1 hypothetical protein [Microbacterium sp. SORGH_AS_0888]